MKKYFFLGRYSLVNWSS